MEDINKTHEVIHLHQFGQRLRADTLFAERQTVNHAKTLRTVSADLAALNTEEIFKQLREMIALVNDHKDHSADPWN